MEYSGPPPPCDAPRQGRAGCIKLELLDLIEKHSRNGSSVGQRLKELRNLRKKLEKQRIDLEKQLHLEIQLQVSKSVPTLEAKTITFVKELERAKKYLEFKVFLEKRQYTMHDSVALEVFEYLDEVQKARESFKELEFQDIMDALKLDFQDLVDVVNENILVLQIERDRKHSDLRGEAAGARIPNPFTDLVYCIHEKGYVMDQDPLVELDIIKKKYPVFYNDCFMARLVDKYLEKEVTVQGIPLGYDEEKIRASLSACGDIEHVKIESWTSWSNAARVTFCSAEAAKLAPFLNKDVRFTILPSPKPEECHAETGTDSIEEYNMARRKYDWFRNLAKRLSKQNRRRRQRLKKKILKSSRGEGQPIPDMSKTVETKSSPILESRRGEGQPIPDMSETVETKSSPSSETEKEDPGIKQG